MSSDCAISAEGLGKCYTIYKRPEHRLKQMLIGRGSVNYEQFWALRDVNLNIRHGETIGIVGRNGSGKSTLLQIICGTLTPSRGKVTVAGRVAALLELGAGFNPEFTGRENVFISATIAGYSNSEIKDRFEQITEFADIGYFIDQPVKIYSSGMYARLAFAVAINIDPDILVLDEVLAVGDEAFQRKCYARIEQIKRNGATILFVSHAASTIIELCDRAILFHNGERLFTGTPKEAVFFQQKLGNALTEDSHGVIEQIRSADAVVRPIDSVLEPEANTQARLDGLASIDPLAAIPISQSTSVTMEETLVVTNGSATPAAHTSRPTEVTEKALTTAMPAGPTGQPQPAVVKGSLFPCYFDGSLVATSVFSYEEKGAGITNPRLLTPRGELVNQILRGERYELVCDVIFERYCPGIRFYALIRTPKGIDLAGCSHPILSQPGIDVPAGTKLMLTFPFHCMLNPGTFFCNFAVQALDGSLHHRIVDALAFRVVANNVRPTTGIIDLGFAPTCRILI